MAEQTKQWSLSVASEKTVRMEHIAFVQQPNSLFIGHKTVANGSSEALANAIKEIVADKLIPIDEIKAIGCDGTAANTGHNGGAIHLLELEWKRPLHWIICMLHMNELPLRALITNLDGPFNSKNSLTGPVGKRLTEKSLESLEITAFEAIEFSCDVLDTDYVIVNSDQQYLFDMCKAVSDASVPRKLANRVIGPLRKVRWVTTVSRILRLYVSEEFPCLTLSILAEDVMKSYAPMIFELKFNSSVAYGPIHLAKLVKSTQALPNTARAIVNQSIQRNAYFAHAEHITVAMVNDDREEIRLSGWQSILAARETDALVDRIRTFKPPNVNFNCESYLDLINYSAATETNSPLLRDIEVTESNIRFLASVELLSHDFGSFIKDMPLHTQSVERTVK